MRVIIAAFSLLVILFLSSCQREANGDLSTTRVTGDTATHVSHMFKVVEVYAYDADSDTRVVNIIHHNGQKAVEILETYSAYPADSFRSIYSYDAQGHLSTIIEGPAINPSIQAVKYQFTWNANQLTRVVCDTFGVFAQSYDYTYTPSGANTIISGIKTPSDDLNDPGVITRAKHSVVVNAQFQPVSEQHINYSFAPYSGNYDPSLPAIARDTTNSFFTYSGADLISTKEYYVACDTNSVLANAYVSNSFDTSTVVYNRATTGGNFSDSLKSIYGNELYTMANLHLFDFFYLYTSIDGDYSMDKNFYSRPYTAINTTNRYWRDGFFDASNSLTNQLWNQMETSFDTNGRLIQATIHSYGSIPQPQYTLKIYY